MSIGVEKIKIPLKPNEITAENISLYLPSIMTIFNKNKTKIRKNYEICKGQHEILNKTRLYDDQADINNQIVEPHLYAMVDFKCGYVLGNPKEYAQNKDKGTDDINYLTKYITDCNMRTIDSDVAKWIYATGVGYYFIQPKEIIENVDKIAPFNIYCLEADNCAKVYSSYIGQEPLFDIIVTPIKAPNSVEKFQISIYTSDWYYLFDSDSLFSTFSIKEDKTQARLIYKMLPLVEKYSNSDRLGIVEAGVALQNALDKMSSTTLDNIEEVVNELYVFINVLLGKDNEEKRENFQAMRRNGVAEINPNNPQFNADLKTISTTLEYKGVSIKYQELKQTLYDTFGVPLASSSVSSGGDTGQARMLGNGWDNAYTVILKDINSFIEADREVLKRILFICKKVANSKVDELEASEIDIKYNINRSDNLLVKSQSYSNFVDRNVPPEIALNLCGLTSDPHTVGKIIEDYSATLNPEQKQ